MPRKQKELVIEERTPEGIRNAVNKHLGTTALRSGSDPKFKAQFIPTGALPIDSLLMGGIPRGRFTIFQGDYSTLKSWLCYMTIAQCQAQGGIAALADTENVYDEDWARECGVDTDDLIYIEGSTAEEKLDVIEAMIYEGIDLVAFDSVAAMNPQQDQQKRLHGENATLGRQAALLSLASRKLTAANTHRRTALIWTNQLRENIGIMFGPSEKAPGGRALPFYASYIVDMRKAGKITQGVKQHDGDKWVDRKEQIGQTYTAKLLKSKLNKPFRDVFFDWDMVNNEIDMGKFYFTKGLELGIIQQKGSIWTAPGARVNGKDNFIKRIREDYDLQTALDEAVRIESGLLVVEDKPKKRTAAAKAPTAKKKTATKPLATKKTLKRA